MIPSQFIFAGIEDERRLQRRRPVGLFHLALLGVVSIGQVVQVNLLVLDAVSNIGDVDGGVATGHFRYNEQEGEQSEEGAGKVPTVDDCDHHQLIVIFLVPRGRSERIQDETDLEQPAALQNGEETAIQSDKDVVSVTRLQSNRNDAAVNQVNEQRVQLKSGKWEVKTVPGLKSQVCANRSVHVGPAMQVIREYNCFHNVSQESGGIIHSCRKIHFVK